MSFALALAVECFLLVHIMLVGYNVSQLHALLSTKNNIQYQVNVDPDNVQF